MVELQNAYCATFEQSNKCEEVTLKTGLGAEKLQLQTAARLFAAVALLSVVALALLDKREKIASNPTCRP